MAIFAALADANLTIRTPGTKATAKKRRTNESKPDQESVENVQPVAIELNTRVYLLDFERSTPLPAMAETRLWEKIRLVAELR